MLHIIPSRGSLRGRVGRGLLATGMSAEKIKMRLSQKAVKVWRVLLKFQGLAVLYRSCSCVADFVC